MSTFYTSDWHFAHVNILTYCPQRYDYLGLMPPSDPTVPALMEEMNEALVALWNRQVTSDDLVWVIGDMCMGKVAETLRYVERLNGTKNLVLGNHDRPHECATRDSDKRADWANKYHAAGFDLILYETDHDFDGIAAHVCHFPYDGDHSEEVRYQDWRPTDNGGPLVHGHLHDLYQTNGRCFNVGIDAWAGQMCTPEQIGDYFRSIGFTS